MVQTIQTRPIGDSSEAARRTASDDVSYVESHKVSAIYPSRAEAEGIRFRLIESGISDDDIEILQGPAQVVVMRSPPAEGSDDVLKEMLVDGAIGTAVGTGLGAIGTGIIWVWGITLFVASPVVAPLAMVGWFASVGGLVGAAAGVMRRGGGLTGLVADAVEANNSMLVARTYNQRETALAMGVIAPSLRGRDETVSDAV